MGDGWAEWGGLRAKGKEASKYFQREMKSWQNTHPECAVLREGASGKYCFGECRANGSKETLWAHSALTCGEVWAIQRQEEKVQKAVLNILIAFCLIKTYHWKGSIIRYRSKSGALIVAVCKSLNGARLSNYRLILFFSLPGGPGQASMACAIIKVIYPL